LELFDLFFTPFLPVLFLVFLVFSFFFFGFTMAIITLSSLGFSVFFLSFSFFFLSHFLVFTHVYGWDNESLIIKGEPFLLYKGFFLVLDNGSGV